MPNTHRYVLTQQGRKIAIFMTKTYARVVRPIFQRLDPKLDDPDDPLRRAWRDCEHQLDRAIESARIAA